MLITSPLVRDALINALADDYSRKILIGTIHRARSVDDLSTEQQIPLSTAYRRVGEMKDAGLLTVEKTILTNEGKKYDQFRSSFRSIRIDLDHVEIIVNVILNEDVATRLSRLWARMREG